MEPNPGITKYYPFMSKEGVDIVNLLLDKASTHPEFGELITQEVCKGNAKKDLVMLALRTAFSLASVDLFTRISNVYDESIEVQAWVMWGLHFFGLLQDKEPVMALLSEVANTTDDPSIRVEADTMRSFLIREPKFLVVAQEIQEMINADESLEVFRSNLYNSYSSYFYSIDNYELSTTYAMKALSHAQQIDDPFQEIYARMSIALGFQNADSLKNLMRAEELCIEYGAIGFLYTIYNNTAFAYVVLGEYDKAIEYYTKAIENSESMGMLDYTPLMNLGVLYGNLGAYDLSLEYAQKAFTLSIDKGQQQASVHIELARALILSERYDEAFEYLETGGKLAIESGSKKDQGRYYLVRGILARERGNYQDALSSFKRGLNIADEIGNLYHSLQILFNLAEAEIAHYSRESEGGHIDSSSLALSRIELIAEEQRLPGLLVQVAILKAEIEKLMDNPKGAREHLERARGLCDTFKIENLRKKIEERMQTLEAGESRPSIIGRIRSFFKEIVVPLTQGKKVSYEVYGCILIMRDAGLEVYSRYTDDRLTSDPSLVAGLITAVSSFTKELREDTQGSLQSIVHQDIAVLLEHGEYAICALLTDKETYEARMKGTRFLDEFEKQHERSLEESKDGMVKPIKADGLYDSFFS